VPWWAGATCALGCLGRWDNARAEVAPRWEAHGAGATRRVSEVWALALVWCGGAGIGRAWLAAFQRRRLAASLGLVGALGVAFFTRGVSHPGGPRRRPIGRKPRWAPGKRPGPSPKWRFVEADESHRVTDAKAPPGVRLTGAPAGRQIWEYDDEDAGAFTEEEEEEKFDPSANPNASDRVFRRQRLAAWSKKDTKRTKEEEDNTGKDTPSIIEGALHRGFGFYEKLQCEDGHFGGDYGGPHFLSPGLVIAWYVLGKREDLLNGHQREAMLLYYRNHQQVDGGWGTHVESPSTMFGTTLTVVAMRLMGADPATDEAVRRGLAFVRTHGGATHTSSWAKFGLCLLGVMDWDGHESVPPEMWLLPEWFPFHPCRMWCHARMVYLPMSYLWGRRYVYRDAETDPLILELRKELYDGGDSYDAIDWRKSRSQVADLDNYSPVHPLMKVAQRALRLYEDSRLVAPLRSWLRRRGVAFAAAYAYAEDQQTNYVCIGPVNKVYNLLVASDDGTRPDRDVAVEMHCLRVPDYLWVAEDGMKMQGYNGSQCWDTSFLAQALVESPAFCRTYRGCARKALAYLEKTQILSTPEATASPAFEYEAVPERRRSFRHVSKGGWPFSTSAHGWPISDCTAEGLKSVLALTSRNLFADDDDDDRNDETVGTTSSFAVQRLFDAVDVILTLQNHDGSFATYENNRGYGWYEALNPSEVFGDIMIDYGYVECSMASAGALRRFHDAFPAHRPREIKLALQRCGAFLKSIQRPDGSWYGSWGCCFTYAGWFGIEGLVDATITAKAKAKGKKKHSLDASTKRHVAKACAFLLSKQNANGSWGEDFTSCFDKAYAPRGMEDYGDDQGGGVVTTAWALLGLMAGSCPDVDAVQRGVDYLVRRQQADGDWPQEGISGVFNRSCGITYTAYRNVFPLWALARFQAHYKPLATTTLKETSS